MDYEHILFDVADGVATITLNRPERRNAWTRGMGIEIRDALMVADERDDVRAIVVTGAGRDFCVGADLEGGGTVFERARAEETGGGPRLTLKAWDIRKPIIAALNGAVAGVGATLPLQWDIRLAGESTRIGFVFVRRGLVPEAASTWTLPRIIGMSRAAELLLTGRLVNAREALEYGLVSRVVPDAELVSTAQAMARDIATQTAPVAVALTKRLLWRFTGENDPEAAEHLDAQVFGWTTQSPDAKEGIRAFLDKRTPQWTMSATTDLPDLDCMPPAGQPAKKKP
ncbi:MAG TPA: enoyl-CoA hydratase-related protein [Candidatus Binatia bacterium]|jgi:enoyl-CoA hydratase/carnithine racemase|nr:enoyl-CoA hydratase-related protein [Candidatus Binatia bacterium]